MGVGRSGTGGSGAVPGKGNTNVRSSEVMGNTKRRGDAERLLEAGLLGHSSGRPN